MRTFYELHNYKGRIETTAPIETLDEAVRKAKRWSRANHRGVAERITIHKVEALESYLHGDKAELVTV